MLRLMTPDEVVAHAELFATTDLERALLEAIEHFEMDLDDKVTDAENSRDEATEERDEVQAKLDDARKRMTEAHALLLTLVGDSDEARAVYGDVLDLLESDE